MKLTKCLLLKSFICKRNPCKYFELQNNNTTATTTTSKHNPQIEPGSEVVKQKILERECLQLKSELCVKCLVFVFFFFFSLETFVVQV